ncbi:twin-arginine translocation signal domain-containing protein, partial [Cereibacter azotoformans]
MTLTRRDLIKAQAAATAAAAAGLPAAALAQPVTGGAEALRIRWSK